MRGGVELQNTQTEWTASGGVEWLFWEWNAPKQAHEILSSHESKMPTKEGKKCKQKGFH